MGCGICGKSPGIPCGGCGNVQYCGKDCQRADWKAHKPVCLSYKVVESVEEHGHHAIASRDIKAGEKIMLTAPEMMGPRLYKPPPCCLGCHNGGKRLIACGKCALPVCSTKCSASTYHQLECALVAKYRHNLPEGEQLSLQTILPLRVLALQFSKPEVYNKILSMESNCEEIHKRKMWKIYESDVIEPLLRLGLPSVDRELLARIVGIICTNAFEVLLPNNIFVGIFRDPALMNHHCVGNTRISMDKAGTMTVNASVPIKKNSPIKFNYVKGLDTTWVRQVELKENKYFSCRCDRCTDPTELGAFTSAHKCSVEGCGGVVLPTDPLSMEEEWTCRTCNNKTSSTDISSTLQRLNEDMEKVDKNSIKDLKNLLKKYENILNRNHGVLIELKQMIVSGLGRLPGYMVEDMKESDHKYKIQLSHEVLSVLDIVEPGLNLSRGLILFELHTSFVMAANNEFERNRNPSQLLVRLLEAEKYLCSADAIIRLEPPSSPYGHLAETIKMNKYELSEYIQSVKMM